MSTRRTIVGLGEILWDVFPDGPKFGGLPANFACTTAELTAGAADIYIVGAVGPDPLGREAVELLASHGVDTAYVQLADYPTGQVNVALDHAGKPTFEIAEKTAWDHIAWSDDLGQLAKRADAICFGSLAQRSPTSRDTIRRFVQTTHPECLRILDINLRSPFWTDEVIRESLRLANVLKLNDTELPVLASMLNLSGCDDEQLASLLKTFNLKAAAFTRGADGATFLSATGERSDLPAHPTKIVDTVGAGDAYTAALAIGLLDGTPLKKINAWGNQVAAFVCSQAGATPHFPSHLRQEIDGVLFVPAKQLPISNVVSPQLRNLIAQPVPPVTSLPATADAWRELQRQEDAEAAKISQAAAAFLGVTIEPTEVGGVSCFRVTPSEVAEENRNRLIVHVHGGAFVFNAGVAGTGEAVLLADACKTPVLSIDYRMPPDHPFPVAAHDVLAVWKAIAAEHDPAQAAMAGTSAGSGLILTTMLQLRGTKLPQPAALFIGTPASDLSKTGDSVYLNAEVDNLLGRYEGRMEACVKLYAAGRDLKEPLISPLYGDLSGFPPTILISGTRDLLLSATIRTHRKLRSAGVTAELHVYEGQSHAMYLTSFPSPESRDALSEIANFFDRYMKR